MRAYTASLPRLRSSAAPEDSSRAIRRDSKGRAPLKDVVDDAAYLALTFGSAETDLGREGFHIYCMIGSARQPKSPLAPRP